MNILIYRTGRLGDFLVAVPAMNLVRRAFPTARITLLTCASTMPAFASKTWAYADPAKALPWTEFVQPNTVDEVISFSDLRSWKQLWSLRKQIRQRKIRMAFILPFTWETKRSVRKKKLFLRIMGVHGTIYGATNLVSVDVRRHQVESAIASIQESAALANTRTPAIDFRLSIAADAEVWAGQAFDIHGFTGAKVIAVFVGGSYEHKRWPIGWFVQTCRNLAGNPAVRFVVIGSSDDRASADVVVRSLAGRAWNACGETDLQRLAALLKRCTLLFGNDSGPGHLAAALGCPTVTIISGIYPPGIWEPRGAPNITLRVDVACSPCRCETHCPTKTRACIDQISVARVTDACSTVLNSASISTRRPSPNETPA